MIFLDSFSKKLAVLFCLVVGRLFSDAADTPMVCAFQSPNDVCSIFGVVVANANAITKGDLIVTEAYFLDTVVKPNKGDHKSVPSLSGIVVDEIRKQRLVFDFENNRFAVFSTFRRNILDLGEIGGELKPGESESNDGTFVYESVYGCCWKGVGNKIYRRWDPNNILADDRSSFPEPLWKFLSEIQFKDYRFIVGNVSGQPDRMESVEREFLRYQTGDDLVSKKIIESQIIIELCGPKPEVLLPPNHTFENTANIWTFDLESGMPVSNEFLIRFRRPNGELVETSRNDGKVFEWEMINNVYAIKSMQQKGRDNYLTAFGTHSGPFDRKIEFNWISVNQNLNDDQFDEGVLADSKQIINKLNLPPRIDEGVGR